MLKTYMLPLFAMGLIFTGAAQAENLIPANIHEPLHANMSDCYKLAKAYKKTTSHMEKIPQATQKMAHNARSFCALTYYGKGVAIYERALHTLEK